MEDFNDGRYTYLNMMADGKIENQQFFIISRCISEDSKISTPKGKKILGEIQEVTPFPVYSFNLETLEMEIDEAIKTNPQEKEVFELRTVEGKKIKASKDHIFFVKSIDGIQEKKLEELKEGDLILVF